jgi:hypothetical protein
MDAAKALVRLSLQNQNTTSPRQTNHTEVHDDPQDNDTSTGTDTQADDTPVENTSVNNVNAQQTRSAGQKTPTSSPPLHTLLGRLKPSKETGFQGNVHRLTYRTSSTYSVASTHTTSSFGSLVDRGANGGLAGTDMRVIAIDPNRKVCMISGLDNHQVPDLDIVTAVAYLQSQRGPVIGIFHGYARMPNGHTIHSSDQLEHYKLTVDDRPMKVGGTQCITTPDGYAFPLDIHDGLSYLQCRTYTDEEFEKLPHVIMTSDVTWEPSILDCTISSDDKWHNTVLDLGRSTSNPFDEFGRYKQRQGPPIPLPVVGTPLWRAHPCQTSDIHYMIVGENG